MNDDSYVQTVEVLESKIHPDYKKGEAYYDIAVLKTTKITYSINVSPICLPENGNSNFNEYEDKSVELIGWGSAKTLGDTSDTLKRLTLSVYPFR